MKHLRIDSPHPVPRPPVGRPDNCLNIVRPDTGPCCQCSSPGGYLLEDSAKVQRVLCGSCTSRLSRLCGYRLVTVS